MQIADMDAADIGLALPDAGFGVGGIEHVVLVHEQPARFAELGEGALEAALLVIDVDAAIAAVGDQDLAFLVDEDRMAAIELAVARQATRPLLEELAGLVELHDAVVGRQGVMAVGDIDIAGIVGDDVRGLAEMALVSAIDAWRADAQQELAGGAELQHLGAQRLGVRRHRREIAAPGAGGVVDVGLQVGDPDIAGLVDINAVRIADHVVAEGLEELAVGAELHDRIDMAAGAEILAAAAFSDPDRLAVLVDVDGAGRAQETALGHGVPGLVEGVGIDQRLVFIGALGDVVVALLAAATAARTTPAAPGGIARCRRRRRCRCRCRSGLSQTDRHRQADGQRHGGEQNTGMTHCNHEILPRADCCAASANRGKGRKTCKNRPFETAVRRSRGSIHP